MQSESKTQNQQQAQHNLLYLYGTFDCRSNLVERGRRKHELAGDGDRRGLASRIHQLLNRNPLAFTEFRFGRRLSLESGGVPAVRPLLWCQPTICVDSFRPLASDQLRRGNSTGTNIRFVEERRVFPRFRPFERSGRWEIRKVGFIHYRAGSLDDDLPVDRSSGRADFGFILRQELDNSIRRPFGFPVESITLPFSRWSGRGRGYGHLTRNGVIWSFGFSRTQGTGVWVNVITPSSACLRTDRSGRSGRGPPFCKCSIAQGGLFLIIGRLRQTQACKRRIRLANTVRGPALCAFVGESRSRRADDRITMLNRLIGFGVEILF